MTSVSDVLWKIEPSASSFSRSSTAFTRLPLWPLATEPPEMSTANGDHEDERTQKEQALCLQLLPQLDGVHQVAVVADRHRAARIVDRDRLGVLQRRLAGRRVANVTDGGGPAQLRQPLGGEDVAHEAHLTDEAQPLAGRGDDPR